MSEVQDISDSTTSKQGTTTVSLADEEGVKRILVDTVFSLRTVVNNLTRLRLFPRLSG
jgi:hypothetical protein